ncbi:MAG: FecR domain-containing protein, partial [Nitrospirota bacterium]|nr:FecR domain-containing protein [Nitrospirota bacterium]
MLAPNARSNDNVTSSQSHSDAMKQLTNTSYFSGRYSAIVLSGFFLLNLLMIGPQSAHALSCSPWVAELISLEGEASARKSDDAHWQAVEIDIKLCPGDAIQIAANSRAILRLSDHSLMRLDARTTVTFMPPKEEGGFWISLLKGIGHFISRVPRELNVRTPVADAKIEGTEFLIRANADEMFVTVFEGTVLAKNDAGELRLTQGQSAGVQRGRVPVMQAVVRPRDAVQWALHYPSVLQFEAKDFEDLGVSASSRIAKSIASLKQGDRKKALEHLHEMSGQIDDTRFLTYRASLHLSLGRVSEALDDLEQALVLKPEDGDILALKALVAVVQNDQDSAFTYADKAIKAAPNTAGPLMAHSYV